MTQGAAPAGATTDDVQQCLGPEGRYRIRKRLGSGGYGEVFEAWDGELRRIVAIKSLALPVEATDWNTEARLSSRVLHPAVVVVHDVFVHQGFGHIVMERVSGQDLAARCREGPVSPREAAQWICQASAALAEAHRVHIVHGDIKPANLMIDHSGRLRVLDFGIARALDRTRTLQAGAGPALAGTLAYMAPEQLLGQPPSMASDAYALGRVFLALLHAGSNGPPEPGLALAWQRLQGNEDNSPTADAPACLRQLIERMTQRDPARRLDKMEAIHRALEAFLADRPRWQLPKLRARLTVPRLRPAARHGRLGLRFVAPAIIGIIMIAWRLQDSPPWPTRIDQAERAMARADVDEGALDTAIAELQSVLADRPGQPVAASLLSVAYAMAYTRDSSDPSWLERADASAQLAAKSEDQLALGQVALGRVATLRGQHAQAASAFQRALALDPRNYYALVFFANDLMRQQRFSDARKMLERVLALYPQDAPSQTNLGRVAYEEADYARAERLFRVAIAAQPRAQAGYAGLSQTLARENREEEALQVLQEGLRVHPTSVLYTNLGTTLFMRGDYVAAARAFEDAVSAGRGKPNDYLMWANLADALRWIPGRDGDERRARQHALNMLRPLLVRDNQDATLPSRAGLYAAQLDDKADAVAWSGRALALAPAVPDVLFRAAMAYELCGDRDTALVRLQQALGRGYPAHLVDKEPALAALRRDRRYQLSIHPASSR